MKFRFLSVAAAALMFAACNEPLNDAAEVETFQNGDATEEETIMPDDGAIVLGEKLPNPYSLDNMRKAIEEYNKSGLSKSALSTEIQPTHYYIKFKPKNDDDINKLDADSTIFFYSYPLDYEILKSGDYYHDSELPDSIPTYQYCAVEISHKLPNVEYEILDNLYILEDVNVYEDGETEKSISKHIKFDYWEELEDVSLKMLGIETEKTLLKRSKWTPQGRIQYMDDYTNSVKPMQGVPVHMRKSMFVGHQCCTDANGFFSFSRIRKRVDFSIKWKRSCFKIKPNTGAVAAETTLAEDTHSAVYKTFSRGENAWKYASVFRAALNFCYGSICGLTKPTSSMIVMRASDKEPSDKIGSFRSQIIGTDIHIFYLNDRSFTSRNIYATTTHEIAHFAHHDLDTIYKHCDKILKESWARGVEWYITKQCAYPDYNGYYSKNYAMIVQDLIDNDNSNNIGHDKVSGYTITQMEYALKGAKTWNDWKNNLKNYYNNGTEIYLDDLFSAWASYE